MLHELEIETEPLALVGDRAGRVLQRLPEYCKELGVAVDASRSARGIGRRQRHVVLAVRRERRYVERVDLRHRRVAGQVKCRRRTGQAACRCDNAVQIPAVKIAKLRQIQPRHVVREIRRRVLDERDRSVAAALNGRPRHLELSDRQHRIAKRRVDAGAIEMDAPDIRRLNG